MMSLDAAFRNPFLHKKILKIIFSNYTGIKTGIIQAGLIIMFILFFSFSRK